MYIIVCPYGGTLLFVVVWQMLPDQTVHKIWVWAQRGIRLYTEWPDPSAPANWAKDSKEHPHVLR